MRYEYSLEVIPGLRFTETLTDAEAAKRIDAHYAAKRYADFLERIDRMAEKAIRDVNRATDIAIGNMNYQLDKLLLDRLFNFGLGLRSYSAMTTLGWMQTEALARRTDALFTGQGQDNRGRYLPISDGDLRDLARQQGPSNVTSGLFGGLLG